MKVKIFEGAIISIPLDDMYVVSKILYLSNYFKNTALFKIYTEKLRLGDGYESVLSSPNYELIYSGTRFIQNGRWTILGTEAVTSLERESNRRIVGGNVWLADECKGSATDDELKKLPKMKVYNVSYIEQKVSKFPVITSI